MQAIFELRACEGGKSLRLTQTPGMSSPGLVGLRRSETSLGASNRLPRSRTDNVSTTRKLDLSVKKWPL